MKFRFDQSRRRRLAAMLLALVAVALCGSRLIAEEYPSEAWTPYPSEMWSPRVASATELPAPSVAPAAPSADIFPAPPLVGEGWGESNVVGTTPPCSCSPPCET